MGIEERTPRRLEDPRALQYQRAGCSVVVSGKRRSSPLHVWVKKLFSNPANDENWKELAERLSVNVVADALVVCRQALFSFPPRKFPWNNPAALSKAQKNAKELAAFLREWDSVPWVVMRRVAETAELLDDLAAHLKKAGNPIQQLENGKFDVGGIVMQRKPGRGRRPVDPINYTKPGRGDWMPWRATSMLDTFFRERFGPTRPKREETTLLPSIVFSQKHSAEQVKRTMRTFKEVQATPPHTTPPNWSEVVKNNEKKAAPPLSPAHW
ncbi:MAG TPA: hypothetical protein VF514_09640 [Bacteroidota bacterium]